MEYKAADAWNRQPKFPNWFGKGCKYLSASWEDSEAVAGPDWMELEPILTFCNNSENIGNSEGNCNPTLCPKLK